MTMCSMRIQGKDILIGNCTMSLLADICLLISRKCSRYHRSPMSAVESASVPMLSR